MVRKSKLACPESIADLWGWSYGDRPKRPRTERLFTAIAAEAFACLFYTDWEIRIRRMENIISVLRSRIRQFWEDQHESDLDRLVAEKKKECDGHVE